MICEHLSFPIQIGEISPFLLLFQFHTFRPEKSSILFINIKLEKKRKSRYLALQFSVSYSMTIKQIKTKNLNSEKNKIEKREGRELENTNICCRWPVNRRKEFGGVLVSKFRNVVYWSPFIRFSFMNNLTVHYTKFTLMCL